MTSQTKAARTRVVNRFHETLSTFREFGLPTNCSKTYDPHPTPVYTNEFWTAKQRDANALHELSYRACFKPQLPRFFIEHLTKPGDKVYDPYAGRATTLIEAALMGRRVAGNDANPLTSVFFWPRVYPPVQSDVKKFLDAVDWKAPVGDGGGYTQDLLAFYHPATLQQLLALRYHIDRLKSEQRLGAAGHWVQMVAMSRLHGHSSGFFSVYTLPPNQAVTAERQRKINADYDQSPEPRDVRGLIYKKSAALLKDLTVEHYSVLGRARAGAQLFTGAADHTPGLASDSVDLTVTSPPFLDVVDYRTDNWLRTWFCMVDPFWADKLSFPGDLEVWKLDMKHTLKELHRVTKPGGFVAFEVGEVKKGKLKLEEVVLEAGIAAKLKPELVLVNLQHFTKTSHLWSVTNGKEGTNTNRVVLFRKA